MENIEKNRFIKQFSKINQNLMNALLDRATLCHNEFKDNEFYLRMETIQQNKSKLNECASRQDKIMPQLILFKDNEFYFKNNVDRTEFYLRIEIQLDNHLKD